MTTTTSTKKNACKFCDPANFTKNKYQCKDCRESYESMLNDIKLVSFEDKRKLAEVEFKYWSILQMKPRTETLLHVLPEKSINILDNIRLSVDYQVMLSQNFINWTKHGEIFCFVCKKSFKTKHAVRRHYKTHDRDSNLSEVDPNKMKEIFNVITDENYDLSIEKYFSVCEFLHDHYNKSHTKGEKAVLCPVIKSSGDNNVEFTCDDCDKSFGKEKSLKKHQLKHTNKLNESAITVSKELTCQFCDREFSNEDKLSKHVEKRHQEDLNASKGDGEYSCPTCDETFTKERRLRRHLKKIHGELVDESFCVSIKRSSSVSGSPSKKKSKLQ